MTTNLLIGYPDIQDAALTWDSYTTAPGTGTPDDLYITPVSNLWHGPRSLEWWGAFSATQHTVEWDLGVGNAKSANFAAFARMDRLTGSAILYYLEARNDPLDSWTVIDSAVTAGGLGDLPRYGSRLRDDHMRTFTASAAFRYWRLRFTSAGAFSARLSKFYCGTVLDLGVEPGRFTGGIVVRREGRLQTSSGAVRLTRLTQPSYRFEGTWSGVTDANLELFESKIVANSERHSFFLFTTYFHKLLKDFRQLHVTLRNYEVNMRARNHNTIRAVFEETLG